MTHKTKKCIICNEEKDLAYFHTDNRLKDKKKGKCKECYKVYQLNPDYKSRRNRQSSESIKRSKQRLTDNYVARQIVHKTSLSVNDIRQYPELIEATRILMITNKIVKNEKKSKNSKKS